MPSPIITDGTPTPPSNNSTALTDHQKLTVLQSIVDTARSCLNIPYDIEPGPPVIWTGRGKWIDLTKPPKSLDCSGLAAGVCHKVGLKMPDGAQFQFNFTLAIDKASPGDFAFFGRDKDITKIHHVGIVYDEIYMIEARGFDPKASFPTGKVILRPRAKWEAYSDWVGYRSHPKLA